MATLRTKEPLTRTFRASGFAAVIQKTCRIPFYFQNFNCNSPFLSCNDNTFGADSGSGSDSSSLALFSFVLMLVATKELI